LQSYNIILGLGTLYKCKLDYVINANYLNLITALIMQINYVLTLYY